MDHAYLGKGCSFDMLRSCDHAWVDNHTACSSGSHAQSLKKLVNLSLTYQLRMLTSKFKTSNGREIVPLRRHSKRTPQHCAKWLRNSPGKRYKRIWKCVTGEVETFSTPIWRQNSVCEHPGGKWRQPDGMAAAADFRM
ncbi:hypothetical protein CK203_098567 [Vitis vinifera]|uniref:Uncharacterized protein n=1 Tax=Vitis vinifera TaxID=29760 RepID=A0A438BMJ2_VITVI|nr:hypothetical protein CK203_098567 [Vitis vinifera]